MTQEDKNLLMKDLSARLPYGVKAPTKVGGNIKISFIGDDIIIGEDGDSYDISFVKPYLFPLSSMTEEQKKELYGKLIELKLKAINDKISRIEAVKFEVDFYNKHHLDWRGFIPKNLAIDCTYLNIY